MYLFVTQVVENSILWVSVLAWFIAQVIKVIIKLIRTRVIDLKLIIGSGGMPSSHSAIVTSMATSIGYIHGFESSYFAMAAVLSMIVMYDATGIRRAAGKQAEVLNVLIHKMGDPELPIDKKLKELLGHTPLQVLMGALLGISVGAFFS